MNEASRVAAEEGVPLGYVLQDELDARYWTSADVAARMGGANAEEMAFDKLLVDMLLYVYDPRMTLDEKTASKLGLAFGVSSELFLNLDRIYRERCASGQWKPPQCEKAPVQQGLFP